MDEDGGKDDEIGAKPCRSMIDEMLLSDMTPDEILIEANTVIAAVRKHNLSLPDLKFHQLITI